MSSRSEDLLLLQGAIGEGSRKRNSGAIRCFLYSAESEVPVNADSSIAATISAKTVRSATYRHRALTSSYLRSGMIVIQTSVILMQVCGVHKIDRMIYEGLPC